MPRDKSMPEFVMCIRNETYPASLEVHKVYRVLPDPDAAGHKMVRIIDESAEDYLYPEELFVRIELPSAAVALFSEAY
jgi:hypothetical protein